MSLVHCGECGKEISDKAVTCPSCGAPFSKSRTVLPGIETMSAARRTPRRAWLLAGLALTLIAAAPGLWRASASIRQAAGVAAAPKWVIDNAGTNGDCTTLGDYCMNVSCAVTNAGDAAGTARVLAVLTADGGGVIATRTATKYLLPHQQDTVAFRFHESKLNRSERYRCEVIAGP